MNIFFATLYFLLGAIFFVEGAPKDSRNYSSYNDDLSYLKYEIQNHEKQIDSVMQRIENNENGWDVIREQVESIRQNCEQVKRSSETLHRNSGAFDATHKNLVDDLEKLHSHQNELDQALRQLQKQQILQDKVILEQKQTLESIRTAVIALTEAIAVDDHKIIKKTEQKASTDGQKFYRVKTGDTLEKIARSEQTTIQAIRQANNIVNDRIIVGQKLKIP